MERKVLFFLRRGDEPEVITTHIETSYEIMAQIPIYKDLLSDDLLVQEFNMGKNYYLKQDVQVIFDFIKVCLDSGFTEIVPPAQEYRANDPDIMKLFEIPQQALDVLYVMSSNNKPDFKRWAILIQLADFFELENVKEGVAQNIARACEQYKVEELQEMTGVNMNDIEKEEFKSKHPWLF